MGKGKPRGLNSARKLRVHRRNKYVIIDTRLKSFEKVIIECERVRLKSEEDNKDRRHMDESTTMILGSARLIVHMKFERKSVENRERCMDADIRQNDKQPKERKVRLWVKLE
ncbi:Rps23a/Rps23b [Kluyveromyces lactis]|nr:Rps23a/Rps23b [Kluyveromyces lactis]